MTLDLYRLRVDSYDVGDGHVAVSVTPHHDDEEIRGAFTLAEWHRAWTDHAGVIGRAAAELVYDFDTGRRFVTHGVESLRCKPCQHTREPLCTVSAGVLVDPTGDWTDAPWLEVTVAKRDRKRALAVVRDALAKLEAADGRVFTEEEEAAWRGAGS